MGTRRWTLSTFVGCCIWILQGLRAAAAVPVTSEEPFTVGTASPIAAETEWPRALGTGAAERSAAEADAETTESILVGSPVIPSFPPGAESGALVAAATSYDSTIPTLTNATKPLNTSQDNERGLAAPTAATTAASIATQHPAVTPEAEHDLTGPAPDAPLGTTPLFADVKDDVLADVAREGADIDTTVGDVIFPSTPSQATTWEAQPTAGSPMDDTVTVLLSQAPATAAGGDKEGVSLPVDIQSEEYTSSSHPSPGAERLLITQQDGAMSRAVGITPEPLGEITGAAKEKPLASVPGDAGDAVNGAFSMADASYLLPESVTISGTVENPVESSLLPGQAELSPAALLTSASGGDGQGAPGVSSGTPGSGSLLAVSETPAVTGDKATSLLAPEVPADAQDDMNVPVQDTVLPTGYTGAMDLTAPWQNPAGERPRLLSASLPFPMDISSSPGAAYPHPGTGASTLPAADNGRETPGSSDLAIAPGAPMSPSAGGPQPWGTATAAPQGAEGPGTGLNSVLDVPSPASFIPDGPNSGVAAQGTEDAGDMALSGGPEDGSPYADTQSDMSPSAISAQKDMTSTGGMLAGGTGALANDELSPPAALGDAAGAASAPGQMSQPGPAPPGIAGLEPDLLGAEGDLPGEFSGDPGVAAGAAASPASAAETPVSPHLGAAQGGPVPLSLAGPEPWGMAAGAPEGAGLPGANRPGNGLTSAWDEPSSASHGPAGPPSPALGDQLGTNPARPAVGELGASTTEQALGGVGSAAGFDPSLSAAAGGGLGGGMDQLPGTGSSSLPSSPSDAVAASSLSSGKAASPGSDSLSPASPESETHPELAPAHGTESTGETAQVGNPESENPYMDTNPSEFSAQQDTTNTGEMPVGETGALANDELSPPAALGNGAGEAPAPGQVSSPGLAPPGITGLEPDLLGAEGAGHLQGESPAASGVAYPAPAAAAETPVSPNLGAAPGGPVPLSLAEPETEPWGMAAGAPQGAGLPGANRPGSSLTSAWDEPSSASHGPAGPPSPALGDQLGTNPARPAVGELGASTTEQALGGVGSAAGFDPSLSAAAGGGLGGGMDQLPGAGSSSLPSSPSDAVAASSLSPGNGAGPIQAASPGSDSLSPASPESETRPELVPAHGTESTGETAQAGNPESENPYMDTNPSEFSAQQDTTNTGGMPVGETGALANDELSPPAALGDAAGAASAPGQTSQPGPAPPGIAGLEPDLLGAEGPGQLQGESPAASGVAYPAPAAAAETPVSPNLGAAQGGPLPLSLAGPEPWGMAAGAPQGAGLPGANRPGNGLTSAWDEPSLASHGPAGPPSPALGDQLGTNPARPAVGGLGASTTEQALGGVGSTAGFDPSLSAAAGGGLGGGMDQLPGAGSSSLPSSPSNAVAASSLSDPASQNAFGGVGGAPGALQPSLGAGPNISPPAEGVGEAAGDRGPSEQSQASTGEGPAVSGATDGEMGSMLHSASSSPSMAGSSSPGIAQVAHGASLPGAGGAGSGLSTGLEAAGPEELPVSATSAQNKADLGLSDAKPSQVNAVELPGGALENGTPYPGASLRGDTGAIVQTAPGALTPSALASRQETQQLVPVAADTSGTSDGTATSLAGALLLPGRGLGSGLAPNGDSSSPPGTQSGNTLGAPSGLVGDGRGAQPWSSEDEVASGMPAPLGEVSPYALSYPSAARALPSPPERKNAAEVAPAGPGGSAPLLARESIVGSSAGGRGGLGAATAGDTALLLPPHHPGAPGVPSWDANSISGATSGRGDMAQLLPRVAGAGAAVEADAQSPSQGSPGLSGLPPARITAGSPGSKIPEPGPASRGSSPATRLSLVGGKVPTRLANGAPAAGGSSVPAASPGQGGAQKGSPATMRPAMLCSPVATRPTPPAPLPGGRKVPLRPGAATVTSHTSFPMFPAPPGGTAATPNLLPGPTVPAVRLYAYGARENDREYVQRRVDFTSPLFKPETGFPFGRTLRDSLYFTDNGQIIFPASDNSIFTYPNPPPSGFNGHEDVPMIAVFWDNADFSRGVGTTFYQEFLTLNTAKPPFVLDVEAKIRQYLRSSYSAAWTLKITWEKVPAYAARTDTRKTITYQAILTTDGFRSYVLMLYQDGGMRWDYTRLAATNVLIGYTSGDGSYRNDDLTRRPPAAKYRPDQFRGYNTDLRGLWIYRLESRVGINYRLKCLAWIGRQQEPRVWSQGLPTCPCSLQQAQQDPRFKSSRGGWWAARISMVHSASPNQHGAGVRCLYDSQNQLVEGRQERYWRSSRQASPYRDQELKLYDWCCNQAGSARLCAHYGEKRPKIGCDGYQSPGTVGSLEEAESDSEEQTDEDDK